MDKATYTALTGAAATLRSQAAVAHNLANVSTTGFKAQLVGTEKYQVQGTGLPTRISAIPRNVGFDASQGPIEVTGAPLDVAMSEGVWLAVSDSTGQEAYSRAGSLQINSNGQLTTLDGKPVLGTNGPVAVPPHEKILIGEDGSISIVPEGQGPETIAEITRLKLVRPEPGSLSRGLDGLFRTAPERPAAPAVGASMISGALEGSNANAATALVQMIELQRQFEAQVKVIESSDENSRLSASLMRLG